MCSWYDQGILREFWRWGEYPYQNQYHLPKNGWVGILEGNHRIHFLCAQHPKLSRQAQRLLCSDLWPNCCRLQIGRKQNYLDGTLVQKDQIWRNPWYRVPNLLRWREERICRLKLHCSTHWCVPIGVQRCHCKIQWGQFHVRLRWFPRTEKQETRWLIGSVVTQWWLLQFCSLDSIIF